MNKTFVTNTQIAPIVDVSTYEGPFSYESLWQPDEEAERDEGRVVCWDYDSEKMGERIVEEANRVFEAEKPLAGYGVVEIRATKLGSPREYNFMSDWLDLSVKVDESFFGKARKAILDPENRKAIVEHCKDHWVSKDGFSSSMLNRVQGLSLNWWEHRRYGRHMSTDEEVEAAVMADLQEALALLENETSEDEFRDFGAVLALLWRFEYPADFDRGRSESWSGSWVTDEMVEHLHGNSSLSEFCTVLDADEVKAKFGDEMVDLDAYLRERHEECERYRAREFEDPERAKRVSENYERLLSKRIDELKDEQLRAIRDYMPDEARVRTELREFRTETWAAMVAAVFDRQFWRDPELEKAAEELAAEAEK